MWTWQYWKFAVPSGNTQTLLVTMEQTGDQSEADCDFYARRGGLPSHTNYDFRDVSLDGTVNWNVTNAPSGAYFIGIFAFRQCSYKIKATLGNACPNNCNGRGLCNSMGLCECTAPWTGPDCSAQIPSLAMDQAQVHSVKERNWAMFRINLPYTYSTLTFTLEQLDNSPRTDLDLYVRRGLPPTLMNFDYANGTMASTSMVSIADAAAGDWYVGVWAYSCPNQGSGCSFRITASHQDRCPNRCSMRGFCRGTACSCSPGFSGSACETMDARMNLGVLYPGHVESFAWNYYTFQTLTSNPIRINVYPGVINDGDCDLYVKRDSNPTIFQYDYRDNSPSSNITLDINTPGSSVWHIGMYGYRRCDYVIKISAIRDEGRCQNGGVSTGPGVCTCPAGWGGDLCEIRVLPMVQANIYTGTVTSGNFVYYNFSLPYTPTDVVFYLKETEPQSQGLIWLYMNQEHVPTIRDHAFEDIDTNTNYHMLKVSRHQLPQRRIGAQNFIVGVYGSPLIVGNTPKPYQLTAWAAPFQ